MMTEIGPDMSVMKGRQLSIDEHDQQNLRTIPAS